MIQLYNLKNANESYCRTKTHSTWFKNNKKKTEWLNTKERERGSHWKGHVRKKVAD